jgi:hypothetical protein
VERRSLAGATAVITERNRVARRRFAKSKDNQDPSGHGFRKFYARGL